MNSLNSPRRAQRAPQMALRFGALPNTQVQWHDGCTISYLGTALSIRLGTHHGDVTIGAAQLTLPLPPEASARQIQDSAEAWLRQQCVMTVETRAKELESRQSVLAVQGGRQAGSAPQRVRCLKIQLSFAVRSPWIAVEADDTLRCNWRLIELAPETIDQHLRNALNQLAAQRQAAATEDLFGTLPT